jgi:hypothetical protein
LWALNAAFAVVGQVGVGPVPISARGSRDGEEIEARSAGAAIAGLAKELAAGIPGSKASIQNLLQARKGTKGALHYQGIDEKAKQAWARRHEQHCLAAIEMLDQ